MPLNAPVVQVACTASEWGSGTEFGLLDRALVVSLWVVRKSLAVTVSCKGIARSKGTTCAPAQWQTMCAMCAMPPYVAMCCSQTDNQMNDDRG